MIRLPKKKKKKVKVLIAIYRELTERDEPGIPLLPGLPVLSRPCLNSPSAVVTPFLGLQSQGLGRG